MAVRHRLLERGSKIGMRGFSVKEGLRALGILLTGSGPQVMLASVDWNTYLASAGAGATPPLLRDLRSIPSPGNPAAAAKKNESWLPQLEKAIPAARRDQLLQLLETRAQTTLGLNSGEEIDPAQPLQELGLDSLLSIELRNALSGCLDRELPATLLFNYPTLNALAGFILRDVLPPVQVGDGNRQAKSTDRPANFSPAGLLDDIEALSDEEVERLLGARATGVSR